MSQRSAEIESSSKRMDADCESSTIPKATSPLEQAVANSVLYKLLKVAAAIAAITSVASLIVVDIVTASDEGVTPLNINLTIFLSVCPVSLLFRILEMKKAYEHDPTGILAIFTWQPETAAGWKSTGGLWLFVSVTTYVFWGARMNKRDDGAHVFMLVNMVFGIAVSALYQLLGMGVEMRLKTAEMPFGPCKGMLIYFVPLLPFGMFLFLGIDLLLIAKPLVSLQHA